MTINSGLVGRAGDSLGGQLIWATGPQFVDILFVVSGFVVFLPTVAQRGNFGSVSSYAVRRAARLLPAYWVSLGMMLLVMATGPNVGCPASPTWPATSAASRRSCSSWTRASRSDSGSTCRSGP